eukprot:781044-Rhodomonas_salina.1
MRETQDIQEKKAGADRDGGGSPADHPLEHERDVAERLVSHRSTRVRFPDLSPMHVKDRSHSRMSEEGIEHRGRFRARTGTAKSALSSKTKQKTTDISLCEVSSTSIDPQKPTSACHIRSFIGPV